DPNNTTAVFGLARCLQARNDFSGAATALELVPASHSLYTQSRIALARVLMHDEAGMDTTRLHKAARTIASISTAGEALHQLAARLLSCAAHMISLGKMTADRTRTLLGNPVEQYDLRRGAESEYRKAARFAGGTPEKQSLVDRANEIRPVTLF